MSVSYRSVWLSTHHGQPDLGALWSTFDGQMNGLLGAAEPGILFFITSTHTGQILLRVEIHSTEPEVTEEWDDVVEAPLDARGTDAWLGTFDDRAPVQLPVGGSYRARLCCAGWDAAAEPPEDPAGEDDTRKLSVDHYLLQLWPSPPAPDTIVRQRSTGTQYWHDVARRSPPPAPLPDQAQSMWDAEVRATLENERAEAEQRRARMLKWWGGTEPDERLLTLGGRAQDLAYTDRALLDLIVSADATAQRALASWATHRLCARASERLDWSAGLAAAEAARPLPPPFHDVKAVLDIAHGSESVWMVRVHTGAGPSDPKPVDPTLAAHVALECLSEPDPLRAAVDCVVAAGWSETDEAAYLRQVRERLLGNQ